MKLNFILFFLISLMLISCKGSNNASEVKNSVNEEDALRTGEYRVGLYKDTTLDTSKITHIIVVGSAVKEDSDQFFQSGLSRAQRYKEVWPDHQVVIMSGPDVKNMDDEQVFIKYKIPVVKTVYKKFTAPLLLDEMEAFDKIASFDFYGHASPWAMIIGKTGAAFDPSAYYSRLKRMRSKFTDNAYATLNACNTGFLLAPDLSQGLGIPVSGSLTSSEFERIESDGFWYKEQDQTEKNETRFNKVSFNSSQSCGLGLCTRMKSARINYSSYWGTFTTGGLSFDKFFCNYENSRDGRCERGMAMSLMTFPSVKPINLQSSIEDFQDVLYDWLCSTGGSRNYYNKCKYGIQAAVFRGDLEYQSHPTNELNCDFISCNAKIVCKYKTTEEGPIPGSCDIETQTNDHPTNVAKEFLSMMRGFEDIRR